MSTIDAKTYEARHELLAGMQDYVGENLDILGDVEKVWQPTDYLPDLTQDNWRELLEAFRDPARHIADDVLVVLVGNMITEEALPSYSVSLNNIARDAEGDSPKPWARWLRGWTAEENRHGDLLNAYLRLTGRVDMRAVEVTIHHLLNNGFNPRTSDDPYNGLIYTSFQERATKVSHGNVGRIAKQQGDANLSRICQRIAGDESRHERFYTLMLGRVLDLDPDGAMQSIRRMIRGLISMPGEMMCSGKDPDLFDRFAIVAQRTGTYTVRDYADILDHLIRTWDIANRPVSGQAARAQDYLCKQPERYRMLAEQFEKRVKDDKSLSFSWIFDRSV